MNGDLISRSAAIEEFYKRIGGDLDANEVYYIENVINSLPTAHDAGKVVERLDELREEILSDTAYDNDTVNHYLDYIDLMIENVKSG